MQPCKNTYNIGDTLLPCITFSALFHCFVQDIGPPSTAEPTIAELRTVLNPHAASTDPAQQSGRPLLCPLCCPYTLVDTAILPRQLWLLHPGPGPHLHPTQFFQPQLPTPSQVQKQLELVNRLSANWGWKILYQSQWSRGMEQLREEARGRKTGLEGWKDERTGQGWREIEKNAEVT